jgi:hypothetical protein
MAVSRAVAAAHLGVLLRAAMLLVEATAVARAVARVATADKSSSRAAAVVVATKSHTPSPQLAVLSI